MTAPDSSSTAALFEARGLGKRYGDAQVVSDLSFEIAPGECLGVIEIGRAHV